MKDSSGDGVQQQDPILFPTGLHELNAKMVSNKFEDLLSTLGTGKWSFLYFICDMYAELLLPAHAMNGVFLAPEVKYTCVPPDQPSVAGVSEDSCMYYVNTTTAEGNTTSQSFACTDWVFDNTTYEWTLTSEFELVCGRAYLRATYQGIQMIATILTCSFLGYFCDRYGRKTMLVVTQVAHSVLCLSVVLSYNFTVILLLRFLQGCFVENVAHSLAMEVCELKWRSMVGILIALPWAFGMMAWGAVASILGNWRWLQLAAALPLFLRMGFHFFVDESPRWLILKGREDEAIAVLRKAARWNGAHLPTDERLREIFREIQLEQKVTMKKEKKEKKQLSDYIPTLLRYKLAHHVARNVGQTMQFHGLHDPFCVPERTLPNRSQNAGNWRWRHHDLRRGCCGSLYHRLSGTHSTLGTFRDLRNIVYSGQFPISSPTRDQRKAHVGDRRSLRGTWPHEGWT
ncbi:organic cation transporter-like protein isoform X5 [Palaemon carinicauda]|uniref:organic cation transporter-like protein isoform X5 n=1 Tax=Palaemon carinicauda TaxID=392227 RepID=UPI0035B61F3A